MTRYVVKKNCQNLIIKISLSNDWVIKSFNIMTKRDCWNF